jgi:hypothetical protein
MNLQQDRHVLVLVGGWNANIVLNPKWVKKYLLPGEDKIRLELKLEPSQTFSPCLTAGDVKISLFGSRLCFSTTAPEPIFHQIQDLACKLADYLPHTPVSAYGVNFVFRAPISERKFLNQDTILYQALTVVGEITEEHSRYTLKHRKAILNLTAKETCAVEGDGNILELDFNFDHQIADLSQLKAGFDDTPIDDYFGFAKQLAQEMEDSAQVQEELQ